MNGMNGPPGTGNHYGMQVNHSLFTVYQERPFSRLASYLVGAVLSSRAQTPLAMEGYLEV